MVAMLCGGMCGSWLDCGKYSVYGYIPKNVCTHVQKYVDYGSWYIVISLQHVALPASNACNY